MSVSRPPWGRPVGDPGELSDPSPFGIGGSKCLISLQLLLQKGNIILAAILFYENHSLFEGLVAQKHVENCSEVVLKNRHRAWNATQIAQYYSVALNGKLLRLMKFYVVTSKLGVERRYLLNYPL